MFVDAVRPSGDVGASVAANPSFLSEHNQNRGGLRGGVVGCDERTYRILVSSHGRPPRRNKGTPPHSAHILVFTNPLAHAEYSFYILFESSPSRSVGPIK